MAKQYSSETKQQAVTEIREGRKTAAAVAAEVGCALVTVERWLKAADEGRLDTSNGESDYGDDASGTTDAAAEATEPAAGSATAPEAPKLAAAESESELTADEIEALLTEEPDDPLAAMVDAAEDLAVQMASNRLKMRHMEVKRKAAVIAALDQQLDRQLTELGLVARPMPRQLPSPRLGLLHKVVCLVAKAAAP